MLTVRMFISHQVYFEVNGLRLREMTLEDSNLRVCVCVCVCSLFYTLKNDIRILIMCVFFCDGAPTD